MIKTTGIDKSLSESYTNSFNEIFNKNIKYDHFERKYLNNYLGFSYHCFAIDNGLVVGACSGIPQKYNLFGIVQNISLLVDVFILEDYRTDPLLLKKMYMKLKDSIKVHDTKFVIAVPNENAYFYWTKIVKFQVVGNLSFYFFPLKFENFITIPGVNLFNFLLKILLKVLIWFNYLIPAFNKKKDIYMEKDKTFYLGRFSTMHSKIISKRSEELYYMNFDEKNFSVSYLLDYGESHENYKSNFLSLINHVLKNETPDLIAFVGEIKFLQLLLLKLPKKFEPQKLPLCIDVIDHESISEPKMMNIKNWDFSLINFDVR